MIADTVAQIGHKRVGFKPQCNGFGNSCAVGLGLETLLGACK